MQSTVELAATTSKKSGELPKKDAALACPEAPEIKGALGGIDDE
jgi:hypothetical protein